MNRAKDFGKPLCCVCACLYLCVSACVCACVSRGTYMQSSGLSVSSSKNLFCGKMRAKQQSLLPPGGNLGRSRISRPSAIDSQLVCRATTWSGGESASRHTNRLPSMVSTMYLSFHCLNMKPPGIQIESFFISLKENIIEKRNMWG